MYSPISPWKTLRWLLWFYSDIVTYSLTPSLINPETIIKADCHCSLLRRCFFSLIFQKGALNCILQAILLLLNLWNNSHHDYDNRVSSSLVSAPLIPLLKRFEAIQNAKSKPPVPVFKVEDVRPALCTHSLVDMLASYSELSIFPHFGHLHICLPLSAFNFFLHPAALVRSLINWIFICYDITFFF